MTTIDNTNIDELHARHLAGESCAQLDRELSRGRGYTARRFTARGLPVRTASQANTLLANRRQKRNPYRPVDPIVGVADGTRARIAKRDGEYVIYLVDENNKRITGFQMATVFERILWRELRELRNR